VRLALPRAVAIALVCIGCGPGAYYYPASNSAKIGEAVAFAAAAGALQVAQAAAEQHARNSAPVTHASMGVAVSPGCDNEGQYGCLSVSPSPSSGDAPEAEMSDDDAREYVLGYVNGVRKLNEDGPLVRDQALDAFAQAGSDELAQDHRPNQHMADHVRELSAASAEIQGSPNGSGPGPLQDPVGAILLHFTGEGAGGVHHDTMLRPEWRKLGVGIAKGEGRTYFTVDFSR
jgi:uncharacterized protein YkwD